MLVPVVQTVVLVVLVVGFWREWISPFVAQLTVLGLLAFEIITKLLTLSPNSNRFRFELAMLVFVAVLVVLMIRRSGRQG
jgi:hypothetical protein